MTLFSYFCTQTNNSLKSYKAILQDHKLLPSVFTLKMQFLEVILNLIKQIYANFLQDLIIMKNYKNIVFFLVCMYVTRYPQGNLLLQWPAPGILPRRGSFAALMLRFLSP